MRDLKIMIDALSATVKVGDVSGWLYYRGKHEELNATLKGMYAAYVAHLGGVCGFTSDEFIAHVHGVLVAANWDGASRLLVSEVA